MDTEKTDRLDDLCEKALAAGADPQKVEWFRAWVKEYESTPVVDWDDLIAAGGVEAWLARR